MLFDKMNRDFKKAKKQMERRERPKLRRKQQQAMQAKKEILEKIARGEVDPREVMARMLAKRLGIEAENVGIMQIQAEPEEDESPLFMAPGTRTIN